MTDDAEHSESDCLSPALVNSTLPYWGQTVISLPNASAPLPVNVSHSPLGSWPNITSSLCTMSLCNKIYTSEVQGGFLNEQIIGATQLLDTYNRTSNKTVNDLVGETVSIPSRCAAFNQTYNVSEFIDIDAYEQAGASSNFSDLQDFVTNQTLFYACLYKTSSLLAQTLLTQMPSFFTGSAVFTNLQTDYAINTPSFNHLNPQSQNSRTNESVKVFFGDSPQLAPLLGDGDVSVSSMKTLFHNLAETMTNHIRQRDSQQASAQGLTYSVQTTVHVVWPWLIFPCLIAVATCVFLALTLYSVKRHMSHDMVWRSSQAALLFHGLYGRDRYGKLVSAESMERAEKSMRVKLERKEEGCRLIVENCELENGPMRTKARVDRRRSSASPLIERRTL